MSTHPIIAEDIRGVLSRTQLLWPDLKGASVFITGATGFFGIWLLETLLAANREFSLGTRILALSRDPSRFIAKAPHLANDRALSFTTGDIRSFEFPSGPVTHIVHAAAELSTTLNADDPAAMFEVCVEGTRRTLDLAKEKRASKFLLTSSGAIYGRQPPDLSHVPEDFAGGPDPLDRRNAYAEGKRAAEFLCGLAASDPVAPVPVSIARCFAFVGPHLPLDVHFAIGNFIRDALAGGPIRINGDGMPYRSYLYAADLVEWLIAILLCGKPGRAYNVGSEEAVSILELAEHVAAAAAKVRPNHPPVEIVVAQRLQFSTPADRYVPNCSRSREELGAVAVISLNDAIFRTMRWASQLAQQAFLGP